MGSLARVVAVLLAAAVGVSALDCNLGTVITDEFGRVVSSDVTVTSCAGDLCMRRSPELPNRQTMHMLGCGEAENMDDLRAHDMCATERCNRVPGLSDEQVVVARPADSEDNNNVLPVTTRYCYVGLAFNGTQYAGAAQPCAGPCASAGTNLGATNATAFFCTTFDVCTALINFTVGAQQCASLLNNSSYPLAACCCSNGSNCNIANWPNIPVPTPAPVSTRIPQACYSGIHLAGQVLSGGNYIACQGDCASLSFQFTSNYDFSIYQCDPVSLCRALSLTNNCLNVTSDAAFSGCCCNYDACIDPTITPPRYPSGRRGHITECYVGLHLKNMTSGTVSDFGATALCDGQCGRVKTVLNGFETEAFFCATNDLCYGLDIVGSCRNISTAGVNIETCCCNNGRNCNTNNTDITPVPPSLSPSRSVVACYEGLQINNQTYSGTFTACLGDCVSLSARTLVAGSQINVTLYTCDPATVCTQMGIYNRCASIANTTVSGCCCDTDLCIDPRLNKYPNGTDGLSCAVGLAVRDGNYSSVYQMPCDGECASAVMRVAGVETVAFICAPRSSCEALAVHNQCHTILGDVSGSYVIACCCDLFNLCNYDSRDFPPPTYAPTSARPPIACLSGFSLNSITTSDKYMACQGECGLVTFAMSVNGVTYNTSMFTCDPAAFCPYFGIQNRCNHLRDGSVSACCCDWNDCIDPTNRTLRNYPIAKSVECFVGLQFSSTNGVTTYGNYMSCNGQCGTVQTTMNGVVTSGFFCSPQALCSGFEVFNDCATRFMDSADFVKICCCSTDNCNGQTNGYNISVPTSAPVTRRTPISCYSGLSFIANGNYYNLSSEDQYMSCFGDCARISYQSVLNGVSFVVNMFTCDPIDLCTGLGMSNSCTNISSSATGSAISGCCCDWNDCLNKRNLTINPQEHKDDLRCFVGLQLQSNPNNASTKVLTGSTMPCNGECAAVATVFNNYNTWAFVCVPQATCDAFDKERTCGLLNFDAGDYLETCCCSKYDNCNLYIHHINVPTVLPSVVPNTTSPIACYAGVALNGNVLSTADRFMSCLGDCAQLTYSTMLMNTPFNVTLFSCDPVSLCKQFGMANSCINLPNSSSNTTTVQTCCCGFNDCIDRTQPSFPVKPVVVHHKDDLQCFVGLQLQSNPMNASTRYLTGASMPCNGHCIAANTHFNGYDTWAFACAPQALCDAFDPLHNCNTTYNFDAGDYLEICCCAATDNCNILNNNAIPTPTAIPTINPNTTNPIACYAGVALNGNILSKDDRYMACLGNCAQVTYQSQINNATFSATILACDPVSTCSLLNLSNSCTTLSNRSSNTTTINACCCNYSDCIDKNTLQVKATTTAAPNPITSSAVAINLLSATIFATLFSML